MKVASEKSIWVSLTRTRVTEEARTTNEQMNNINCEGFKYQSPVGFYHHRGQTCTNFYMWVKLIQTRLHILEHELNQIQPLNQHTDLSHTHAVCTLRVVVEVAVASLRAGGVDAELSEGGGQVPCAAPPAQRRGSWVGGLILVQRRGQW